MMNENKNPKKTESQYLDPTQMKKLRRKQLLIYISVSLIGSLLLIGLSLIWQRSLEMIAFINACYITAFLWFFIGWMILMANMNILSPLTYGFKSFLLIFVGKRPKDDYYHYQENIKENPIHKIFIILPMLSVIPNLIAAIILDLML